MDLALYKIGGDVRPPPMSPPSSTASGPALSATWSKNSVTCSAVREFRWISVSQRKRIKRKMGKSEWGMGNEKISCEISVF